MIYRYQTHTVPGPNGYTIRFVNADSDEPQAIELGEINGWRYVSVPADVTLPEQPAEIQWQAAEVTPALIEALKMTRPVRIAKDVVRKRIELDVGDVHDLLSDVMRLCEFAIALSVRTSNEQLNGIQMEPEARAAYAQRVAGVAQLMDAGAIKLRGDLEPPEQMMMRLMSRYSRITEILAEDYIPQIDRLLPQ